MISGYREPPCQPINLLTYQLSLIPVSALPPAFIRSLEGIHGFSRESFEAVHASGEQVTSIRFNPGKLANCQLDTANRILPLAEKIPWAAHGYYLSERPSFTFDPLFHAGLYYVQEASSMFLEQALKQSTNLDQPLRVLDLCAAPGGKSTHLQSLLSKESLLVSNEVIRQRAAILEENMVKWGAPNAIITNNDPQDFGKLENFFDVIVVDAPCSGSGLFRREPEAITEWSGQAVQLCSQRQQRILADSLPALKPGGVLIYSTCSYSKEEDEAILDWLLDEFSLEPVVIRIPVEWGIVETRSEKHAACGYRFFPDHLQGEGFFLACLRKKDGDRKTGRLSKKPALQKASKNEVAIASPWLDGAIPMQWWKQDEMVLAFPALLEQELLMITDKLYVRHAGITMGKMAGNILVPDHALAMSTGLHAGIVGISLKKEEALQYLRKEPVNLPASEQGWALVKYQHIPLGWVKVLSNRVNNYYPSAWRILKSGNN